MILLKTRSVRSEKLNISIIKKVETKKNIRHYDGLYNSFALLYNFAPWDSFEMFHSKKYLNACLRKKKEKYIYIFFFKIYEWETRTSNFEILYDILLRHLSIKTDCEKSLKFKFINLPLFPSLYFVFLEMMLMLFIWYFLCILRLIFYI